MPIWVYVFLTISSILWLGYIFFYFITYRIALLEKNIIWVFTSRTDILPALYAVTKQDVSKHSEIFREVLSERKKEFSLLWISEKLESFIDLEQHIHHEINFIFQVCNKNPSLLRKKEFLYIRDVMMLKSAQIWKEMKKYKKIIEIYNKIIQIKNYSLIWLILPFSKKAVL